MAVVLLVMLFAALIAYEAPLMVRRKEWGGLALFAGLTLLGFVVSLVQSIGIAVPNPIHDIQFLTGKLAGLFR